MFKPHGCALHHFNPEHFEQCLLGRRIIIIGDSTMRQLFQSLACLMNPRVTGGFFMVSGFRFALASAHRLLHMFVLCCNRSGTGISWLEEVEILIWIMVSSTREVKS